MSTISNQYGNDVIGGSFAPQRTQDTASVGQEVELRVQPVRGKRPGSAKIAITVDRTGSTSAFQQGVPLIAGHALRSLAGTISKLDIDLSSHGDEDFGEMPIQLVQSGTVEHVIEAIEGIAYGGGFDEPESHAQALQRLLDITPWGLRMLYCRNVAMGFLTADTKPLPSGKSMRQLGQEYKAKGVKLILVCQSTPNLQELVDAAGGFLIPISNNPDNAEIQKVVAALCATLTITMSSAGGTIPMSAVV